MKLLQVRSLCIFRVLTLGPEMFLIIEFGPLAGFVEVSPLPSLLLVRNAAGGTWKCKLRGQ